MDLAQAGIKFGIDPLKLDEEWQTHSQMVYAAAKEVADCQQVLDNAKILAEREYAIAYLDVKRAPGNYGLDKVTEDGVRNTVLVQDNYNLYQQEVVKAKHELMMAEAAATALEHRKRALTKMVDLWLHEYYSDPLPSKTDRFDSRRRGLDRQGIREDQTEDNDGE